VGGDGCFVADGINEEIFVVNCNINIGCDFIFYEIIIGVSLIKNSIAIETIIGVTNNFHSKWEGGMSFRWISDKSKSITGNCIKDGD